MWRPPVAGLVQHFSYRERAKGLFSIFDLISHYRKRYGHIKKHTLAGVPSLYLPKRLNYASSEKYLMVRTI